MRIKHQAEPNKTLFWIRVQNPPHSNRMLWAVDSDDDKGISVAYGVRLRDCRAVYVVDAHLHDCLIYHYLHHQINAIY